MQRGENVFVDNYTKVEEFNRSFLKFATIDTSEAHLPDVIIGFIWKVGDK